MTTSRRDVEVAPGFTFSPQHKELTDLYLRLKIAGEPLPAATGRFIHEADVYSVEPAQLASAFQKAPGTGKGHGVQKQPVWYFFSPVRHPVGGKKNARGGAARKPRTIDGVVGKHWHSEHRAKPVEGGSAFGGYMQDFSYMVKDSESGKKKNVRAGWIMYEYGISEEHGGGDLVLCKILPSDRTGEEAPATAAAASIISSKKRKRKVAAEDTTASARPRHTVDQDQHPLPAESLGATTTTEDAGDYHGHTSAHGILLDETESDNNLGPHMASEEGGEDWHGGDPDTAVAQVQEMEPSNFFDNGNNVVMVGPGGDLAVPPAAQSEVQGMYGAAPSPNNFLNNMVVEEGVEWYGVGGNYSDRVGGTAAAGETALDGAANHQPTVDWFGALFGGGSVQGTVDEDEDAAPTPANCHHNMEQQDIPSLCHNDDIAMVEPGGDMAAQPEVDEDATGLVQSITADRKEQHHHHQMEGTQPEPKEPSADEPIYGLPCPAFSPEMIRMCCLMPWPPSPTSMAAILSGL